MDSHRRMLFIGNYLGRMHDLQTVRIIGVFIQFLPDCLLITGKVYHDLLALIDSHHSAFDDRSRCIVAAHRIDGNSNQITHIIIPSAYRRRKLLQTSLNETCL